MSFRASWTLLCPPKKLHCGQRDMCSWSMANDEENWLPLQIKEWFNKTNKKSPKSAQSLGLVKFQVPSPQRVNWKGPFNDQDWLISIFSLLWYNARMFTTVDITVCQYSSSGKEKIIEMVIYINNLETFYIHIRGAYLDSAVYISQID